MMMRFYAVFLVLMVTLSGSLVNAKRCGSKKVNLSGMKRTVMIEKDSPCTGPEDCTSKGNKMPWNVLFNLCEPVSSKKIYDSEGKKQKLTTDFADCGSSAVCQSWDTRPDSSASLGAFDTITYEDNSNGVLVTLSDGKRIDSGPYVGQVRHSKIQLVCDKSAPKWSVPVFTSEIQDQAEYSFTWKHKCFCGKGCAGGLSGGGVFLIILFVFALIYVVAGAVYGYMVQQKRGLDLIPNREMWISFGGLIKDGCLFTKDKFMSLIGRGGGNYQAV